ncbi:MAG: Uma2 family endonuclease [Rhodopirellula sp.]|nr:Uma2 family endonuclease [Rhodopirellula sp.]
MATSIVLKEDFEIPFVRSLDEFSAWARSDDFPDRGRIDYLAGRIEVDRSPEDYYSHGAVKVEVIGALRDLVKAGDLGDLRVDRTRVSTPDADLSAEPDLVFISFATFESGRARLIPKATEEADRFVEVEGAPDLVVEIVSDRSVKKDTVRLPLAYWRAGVAEYWLIDARGEALVFRIQRRGPSAYETISPDSEGFQRSDVFRRGFRLTRRRDRRGGWAFDLEHRP